AFVHHHVHAALEDFLIRHLTGGDAIFLTEFGDDLVHLGGRHGGTVAFFIIKHAGLGFLAHTAVFHQLVGPVTRRRVFRVFLTQLFTDTVTHIHAGQIGHGERPHG